MKIKTWFDYLVEQHSDGRVFARDSKVELTKNILFGSEDNELPKLFEKFVKNYRFVSYDDKANEYTVAINLTDIKDQKEVFNQSTPSFYSKFDFGKAKDQQSKFSDQDIFKTGAKISSEMLDSIAIIPDKDQLNDYEAKYEYLLANNGKIIKVRINKQDYDVKVQFNYWAIYKNVPQNLKPFEKANDYKEALSEFRKLFTGNVSKLIKAIERNDLKALDKLFDSFEEALKKLVNQPESPLNKKELDILNTSISQIRNDLKEACNIKRTQDQFKLDLKSSTAEYHGRNVMILFTAIAAIGTLAALCARFADTRLVGNLLNKMDFRSSSSGMGQVMQNIAKFATKHKGQPLYVAGGLGFATMASMTTARVLDLKRHDKEFHNACLLVDYLSNATQKI